MSKNWIYRAANHLGVNYSELLDSVTEGNDLRWTNKRTTEHRKMKVSKIQTKHLDREAIVIVWSFETA